ncbi:MAG: galactokinase [Kosmotoga sp.]|nr:MAG: galactokinase [Kosmotoga sp.]
MKEKRYYIAPGRINIIGEHTDYNDGYVLPAAINRFTQIGILEIDGTRVRVNSKKYGTAEFDVSNIEKTNDWTDYIKGIFWVLKNEKNISFPGLEIEIKSNIPEGAGLSSSAALEVSVITALDDYLELALTEDEKIKYARKAENDFVGVQCGIMDQFIAVRGKKEHAIFLDTKTLKYEYVPVKTGNYSLIVFNSNVDHKLSGGEYNKRRQEAHDALKELGKDSYRDVKLTEILMNRSNMSEIGFKRAMHVISENERVHEAIDMLNHSNFENLGRILIQSHESLAMDYEVSCEEIDFIVNTLRYKDGVTGCRMIGAGFGGSVLAICEKEKLEMIKNGLSKAYKDEFDIELDSYEIEIEGGARRTQEQVL